MARMILPDGTETTDATTIVARLTKLGVGVSNWPVPTSARMKKLLEQKSLNDEEKAELLREFEDRFEKLKREKGYSARDLVVIHEDVPGLGDMLAKFDKVHIHTDDEVRYIIAGRGYFGFVEPDGKQFLVEVTAGDFINVPKDAEHWFEMRDSKRCKAVRYFGENPNWQAVYTQRQRAFA
jgi:1,2-dihydroxy-3-keto-5-methylthiopentene dioxygenase